MKKNIIMSLIISTIINILFFTINIVSAYTLKVIPLSVSIAGGECIEYIGFGVRLLEIFPMTALEEAPTTSYIISLDVISFLISFTIILIIVFIIILSINKLLKKK